MGELLRQFYELWKASQREADRPVYARAPSEITQAMSGLGMSLEQPDASSRLEFLSPKREAWSGAWIQSLPAQMPGEAVQRVFAAQLFVHGFVHVDPHSANLFVTPTGALAVLDHGIYRRLSDELRVNYARLWLAVLAGNRADIQRCTAALGMPPERWKVVAVMLALAPGMDIPESGNARRRLADDKSAARSLASLTPAQRAAASQRAMALGGGIAAHSAFLESIPRDLLLVLKANNLLRFVNDQLGAPVNRFRIIGEYAQRGAASTTRPSMWLRINTTMAPWLERLARRSAESLSRTVPLQ